MREYVEFAEIQNSVGDTFSLKGYKKFVFTIFEANLFYNPYNFHPAFNVYSLKKPFKCVILDLEKVYETDYLDKTSSKIYRNKALLTEKNLASIYKYEL